MGHLGPDKQCTAASRFVVCHTGSRPCLLTPCAALTACLMRPAPQHRPEPPGNLGTHERVLFGKCGALFSGRFMTPTDEQYARTAVRHAAKVWLEGPATQGHEDPPCDYLPHKMTAGDAPLCSCVTLHPIPLDPRNGGGHGRSCARPLREGPCTTQGFMDNRVWRPPTALHPPNHPNIPARTPACAHMHVQTPIYRPTHECRHLHLHTYAHARTHPPTLANTYAHLHTLSAMHAATVCRKLCGDAS